MISDQDFAIIKAELQNLDAVAQRMERKWGVNRLQLAVPTEWRIKFERQQAKLDMALEGATEAREQLAQLGGMRRAWEKLDEVAEASGAVPAPAEVWEVPLEDGSLAMILHDERDWTKVSEMAKGRQAKVYTLNEIGHMINHYGEVAKVKEVFPGAEVKAIRKYAKLGDDLNGALGVGA